MQPKQLTLYKLFTAVKNHIEMVLVKYPYIIHNKSIYADLKTYIHAKVVTLFSQLK